MLGACSRRKVAAQQAGARREQEHVRNSPLGQAGTGRWVHSCTGQATGTLEARVRTRRVVDGRTKVQRCSEVRGTAGSRHTDLGVAADQVRAATARGG
jgi:hypothetical protein